MRLLFKRRFGCLIGAQFLAAINDNFLKQVFLLIVVYSAVGGESGVDYELQAAATAVFALPFLLFSAFAGNLADRWGKGFIIKLTKTVEVVVAIIATWGLLIDNLAVILMALLLLSAQSSFFSPAKYGILAELLPRTDLSRGNGLLQMTTYVAILLGTALAGVMLTLFETSRLSSGLFMLIVAVIGWAFSLGVEGDEAPDPTRELFEFPVDQLIRGITRIRKDPHLALAVLNFVFVWFLGTILTLNLNVFGAAQLGLSQLWTSFLNVALATGLGLGSYLAGVMSGDSIRPELVPLGGIALSFALWSLSVVSSSFYPSLAMIFLVGLSGGFYLIPVQTMTQDRPADNHRGEVLGLLNFLTYAGVLIASAGYTILVGYFEFQSPMIMVCLGVFAAVISLSLLLVGPRYRPL
ncbi:MAG: MFS transporter [bacterium]